MENVLNFSKTLLYALCVYLGIKTDVVKILFYMMLIDTFLGVLKALLLGDKISPKKLLIGILTKLLLLIVPMILALMAKALSFNFIYFVTAVMNILIVNEGISCVTNIISIKSKKKIENTDYVTMLLRSIHKGLTTIIQRLLGVLEEAKIDNKKPE